MGILTSRVESIRREPVGFFDRNGNDRTKDGPKVKTGPNAGLTRSKNADGRWREKRDDAGKKRS